MKKTLLALLDIKAIVEDERPIYALKKYECIGFKTFNFTAIDFETATKNEHFPCQVGLVLVEDGKIIKRILKYIQPPQNKYSSECIEVHQITPDLTANEAEFNIVWGEIKPYVENRFIIAHNASFDISVLERVLKYYAIEIPTLTGFLCTKKLFGGASLESVCEVLNVPLEEHHNGLSDAEACANSYLAYIQDKVTSEQIKRIKEIKPIKQLNMFDAIYKNHTKLKGDVLKKDLSNADPKNPFYDRKVVITGVFTQERKELGKVLKLMGADIDTVITRKTNFVLVGEEPGPKKMEKLNQLIHDGYSIQVLYQTDLNKILEGKYEKYFVDAQVKKDLTLTVGHLKKSSFIKENPSFNLFAKKQCFVGKSLRGNKFMFFQLLGNLGAEVDEYIYPETNICIISENTFNNLKLKEKDETINYIEDTYNNNKAISFQFVFITENEFLEYYKSRMEQIEDACLSHCYEHYVNSYKA